MAIPASINDREHRKFRDNNGEVEVAVTSDQLTGVIHTNTHTGNDELRVYQENHVCTQNTTATPLLAGATFTGQWQDCLNYQEVNVSIVADKDSATNGLVFQWSDDASIVGDTDVFSYYTANGGTNYTPNPAFRYFRIVYTNGSQAQTTFHLMTILRRGVTGGSFHRIDSTLKDDSDARLTISVPKLKTAQNTYITQTATSAGNAKVSIEEIETGVTIPVSSKFNTNHLDDYTTTNVTYIGQEDASGVWKLIKIDETGNFPVFTYASVTNNPTLTTYTLAWNARTTMTYGVYSGAF